MRAPTEGRGNRGVHLQGDRRAVPELAIKQIDKRKEAAHLWVGGLCLVHRFSLKVQASLIARPAY
jgi:hypothetical protein